MSGMNRLTKTAPPPSPIPTGRGSRSASNHPFDQFLDGSLHVPALSLPETSAIRRSVPAEIDLQSLVSGDEDSVDRIVRSAKNFGVFRIVGHGISVDDLRSLIGGNERVMGQSERESADEVRRVFRERILWIGSGIESLESARRFVGDIERYPDLSANMKHIASKLEAIAEQLNQILFENFQKKSDKYDQKRILEGKESVIRLYRYNNIHQSSIEKNQLSLNDEIENKFCDHSLSLHLPLEHCQIYVQSEIQHWAFEAGPEILVVAIGKQLEEWSLQEFKCFSGKIMFLPMDILETGDYSFTVELNFSSSKSTNVLDRNCETVSIRDQIVIAIAITLLYKLFMFLTSQVAGA